MQNGLYRVNFRAPIGSSSGVIVLEGESFMGGDSGLAYFGTLSQSGAKLTAKVTTYRHTHTGGVSLLGQDDLTITIEGQATSETEGIFDGVIPGTNTEKFEILLDKLPEPGSQRSELTQAARNPYRVGGSTGIG